MAPSLLAQVLYITDKADNNDINCRCFLEYGLAEVDKQLAKNSKSGTIKAQTNEYLDITDKAIESVQKPNVPFLGDSGNEKMQMVAKDLLKYVKNSPMGTEAISYYKPDMTEIVKNMGIGETGRVKGLRLPYLMWQC